MKLQLDKCEPGAASSNVLVGGCKLDVAQADLSGLVLFLLQNVKTSCDSPWVKVPHHANNNSKIKTDKSLVKEWMKSWKTIMSLGPT